MATTGANVRMMSDRTSSLLSTWLPSGDAIEDCPSRDADIDSPPFGDPDLEYDSEASPARWVAIDDAGAEVLSRNGYVVVDASWLTSAEGDRAFETRRPVPLKGEGDGDEKIDGDWTESPSPGDVMDLGLGQ